MLQFDSVSFGYSKQPALLVDISFEVARGEKACLLGLNGSGKSTLLKLAARLLSPKDGKLELACARDKVGFVFQQPLDQIVTSTVQGDVVFTLENLGRLQIEMQSALQEQSQRFELAALLKRHPATLSAGEQQRTALAGVFAPQPELLLLDEPTSYLDYQGRQRLLEAALDSDLTVLAATQFPQEAEKFERVLLLADGDIAFDGPPAELWDLEAWRELQDDSEQSLSSINPASTTSVKAAKLRFGYTQEHPAIDNLSLQLSPGKITAVLGDSGSGKTTLGKLIAGVLEPQEGPIVLEPDAKQSEACSFVMQFPELQFFAETVCEEIVFGPSNRGISGSELDDLVREMLTLVQLDYESFATRSPFTLSGGERRRVALASILALERPVLILDEPTAGLDWQGAAQLRDLLLALRSAGHTILLLTHDLDLAGRVADYFLLLDQGRECWQGGRTAGFPEHLFVQHFGALPPQQIAPNL